MSMFFPLHIYTNKKKISYSSAVQVVLKTFNQLTNTTSLLHHICKLFVQCSF